MNNDTASTHTIHTEHDRNAPTGTVHALAADVVRPDLGDRDPLGRRLLRIRQVVALAGAAATLVQIVVWLMIAVIGGQLDEPWWLWTAVPALIAVVALTYGERLHTRTAHP